MMVERAVLILTILYVLAIISAWLPFHGPCSVSNYPDSGKFYTSNFPAHIAATLEVPSPWIPNRCVCPVRDAASYTGQSSWVEAWCRGMSRGNWCLPH